MIRMSSVGLYNMGSSEIFGRNTGICILLWEVPN